MRLLLLLTLFSQAVAWAAAPTSPTGSSTLAVSQEKPRFGMTYFTFIDGPGLAEGKHNYTPNVLGLPDDDGLRLTAFLSLKYRVSANWSVDFQSRVQWIFNNAKNVTDFEPLRWQSPRIGLSGKMLSGSDWSLSGAINTDFPYFVPPPLGGGFVAERRTTIMNPGMFAKFSYQPVGSKWSVFSLVMPRVFLYADRDAAEPQLSRAGFSPGLKPEFTLSLSPSINYAVSSKVGLRLGTEFTYRKLVLSGWNPLNGSLNGTDINSKAWRLAPVPLQLGVTYEPSEVINVSFFVQGFPVAAQRVRRDGSRANFMETASVGMWVSGTLL